ncbi:aspartate transcarbamoylase, pyrC' subunit [Oceanicaulis alexandrii HTCC2633]|uniref:dihydroorotase n=1 Tax=Oceanicaulis sp. HTCC2633 TaxID=314254 RepID=UPI000066B0D3|nr:amidohydrolase family protein [Oceanicaulis sp. HTCC2633]EAP88959.1 aspartate transcarbamoylase, pyrC' subunit [Oceanicaulis alexandrii HTCC2633] [Oceanicaulis sp. HTCC2633]
MMLFENARLIDPASGRDEFGALRVRDGLIEEIGPDLVAHDDEQVIDVKGAVLAPALIDMRCTADPASTGARGVDAAARAAAAGGVATLVLSPESGGGFRTPEDIAAVNAAALTSAVRLYAAGLCVSSPEDMAEIGLMLRAGALYLGDGGQPVADTRLARRVLAYAGGFDAWVSLRPEDHGLSRGTLATESDLSMRLGLPSRPAQSEAMALKRDASLAALTGARLIFDRVTTREALDAVRGARSDGLEVAVTVPVSHLSFNEMDTGGLDPRYRLEPPLRSENDRQALIDALSDGRIDAVVSDHIALTNESKAHPFPEAAPGSATLEALLPVLCGLAEEGRMSLAEALRPVTSGPADILGLEQGRLEEGAPADLVAFDPRAPFVYGRGALQCRAPSAFSGRRLFGRTLITVAEGAIIHQPEDE